MQEINPRQQSRSLYLPLAVAIAVTAPNLSADPISHALTTGESYLETRYRYELVDQDDANDDARASTLRARLGYESGTVMGFSGLMEVDHITHVGPKLYSDSPADGTSDRPVVADPATTQLNQAYLRFQGLPDTDIKYGRQRLALDNHRFIGTVGWRQNEQTYDGATLVNESLPDTTLTAGYLYNANRIFANAGSLDNHRMRSGVLNARYEGLALGSLTGYSYLLSFSDSEQLSTQTYGLRFSGDTAITPDVEGLYELEYAYQDDYDNNPDDFNNDYYKVEGGVKASGVTVKAGREVLGSDSGNASFSTPLATLHAMNGWADQFLSTGTPQGLPNGLRDTYLTLSGQFQGVNLMAVYHTFESDRNSIDYGDEFGLQATYGFGEHYTVGAKAASYSSDDDTGNPTEDTDKVWLWVNASF